MGLVLEAQVFAALADLRETVDRVDHLGLEIVEVRSETDAGVGPVVDDDILVQQSLTEFVAIFEVERHVAGALLGVEGSADPQIVRQRPFDEELRELFNISFTSSGGRVSMSTGLVNARRTLPGHGREPDS